MKKLIFILFLYLAKFISLLIRLCGFGQASNFPGKIVFLVQKDFLRHFKLKANSKIILISGTNGKSTTCGFVANILKTSGYKVFYNKSGANLLTGIITAFCHYSNLLGRLNYDYIILETDEATLPLITQEINPNVIAITNLFRDQLDRFGELDTTAKLIEKGINNTKDTTIILNADDVRVSSIKTKNKKVYYGLNFENISNQLMTNNKWLPDPEEVTLCPDCNSSLIFTKKFLAHLGDYKCPKCNFKRPLIDFIGQDFKSDNWTSKFDVLSSAFKIHKQNFFIKLIGIYNVYNAICAIAIVKSLNAASALQIQKGFESYSTIFGRAEKIKVKNKTCWIYLIKNPTGTTEVLKTLKDLPNARFLIALNDKLADGRDVSWIWDARFDLLQNHEKDIYVSGKRAYDMALRLNYADIDQKQLKINENIVKATKQAIMDLKPEETLYILPTYTVLLEMQRKGISKGVKQ